VSGDRTVLMSQADGLLLTQTLRATGLDRGLSLLFNPCFLCCPELLVLPGVSW